MTSQNDFSEEEWFLVRSTPSLVGSAVAQAGRSGIGGTMKEVMANVNAIAAGNSDYPDNELIGAITTPIDMEDRAEAKATMRAEMELARAKMAERGIKSAESLADAAIEDCQSVMALLSERATASEAADYKAWILAVAQAVSEAAKEGGFMGMGGERVSDAEEALIARVSAALDSVASSLHDFDLESTDADDGWSAS